LVIGKKAEAEKNERRRQETRTVTLSHTVTLSLSKRDRIEYPMTFDRVILRQAQDDKEATNSG